VTVGEARLGPIIEQDVQRVSHRHSTKDPVSFGRGLEKVRTVGFD